MPQHDFVRFSNTADQDTQRYRAGSSWKCASAPSAAHHWLIVDHQMTCKFCLEQREVVIPQTIVAKIEATRTCTKCGKPQGPEDFYHSGIDQRARSVCKDCIRKYYRDYYHKRIAGGQS